ncbi:MAG: hypothetical protein AAF721_35830 [Myxococcota bacterium]
MTRASWLWIAAAGLTVVNPADARAANTNKARVAPAFWGDSCIVTVDRAVDPVARLGLAIPFEDDDLTEDELPDSRRFQFFALCEDHPVERVLPTWVTVDDAQRSMDAGLIEALPADDEVLATATQWQSPGHDGEAGSCVVAINDAGARMPITCGDTGDGVEWDTTGVPAGSYVVRSYTFEPEKNLWARRPGVVRVVDGDVDPGPTVTLTAPRRKATAYEAPGFLVTGCLAGAAGTTVTLQFAEAAAVVAEDESAWATSNEITPEGGAFEMLFVPPPETVYKALYLRAIATDPEGRTWVAHADHEIVVLPDCGQAEGSEYAAVADGCGVVPADYAPPDPVVEQPSDCDYEQPDDSGDEGVDETAGDDGATAGEGTTGSSGDGTGTAGAGDDGGGGCTVGAGPRGGGWGLVGVVLIALRRRR